MTRHPGCKTVLWDFDGTLGYRPRRWAECVVDAVAEVVPDLHVTVEMVIPHLARGYPWHDPETAHCGIDADTWWERLAPVLAGAAEAVGVAPKNALAAAAGVRRRYVDPSGFRLYDDVLPVLGELRRDGWRHVVLSNHVPELPEIATSLGLDDVVDRVFTSAEMGYEKPRREAYAIATQWCDEPATVWMVGDNPVADVEGAEAVGIPAILVRSEDPGGVRYARDLFGVADYLG